MLMREKNKFDLTEKIATKNKPFDFAIDATKDWILYYLNVKMPDDFSWKIKDHYGTPLYDRLVEYLEPKTSYERKTYIKYSLKKEIDTIVSMTRKDAIIDWTFSVDWKSGSFGDSGSCYWPTSGGYVQSMLRNGVGAVRRYDSRKRGNARAWMAVDQPSYGYVTVYNRYGQGADCLYFAKLLSMILEELELGEFECNSLSAIHRNGSAHINGDAAVLYRKGCYPVSSVTLQLERIDQCDW